MYPQLKKTILSSGIGNREPLDRKIEVDMMRLNLAHPRRYIHTLIRRLTRSIILPPHKAQPHGPVIRRVRRRDARVGRQTSRVRLDLFNHGRRGVLVAREVRNGDDLANGAVDELRRRRDNGAHVKVDARALGGDGFEDGHEGVDGLLVVGAAAEGLAVLDWGPGCGKEKPSLVPIWQWEEVAI